MPHIVLEYSANLKTKPTQGLLVELHQLLPTIGPFDLQSIKSRLVEHAVFCVADGARDSAFVHLQLAILSGRDSKTKREVSQSIVKFLQAWFGNLLNEQPVSLSVEIRDLDADCYSKVSTV